VIANTVCSSPTETRSMLCSVPMNNCPSDLCMIHARNRCHRQTHWLYRLK
jgi:hypothetical protein